MFSRLGTFVARFPLVVIAAWVVALVAVLAATPKLSDVVNSSQGAYLPSDSNSQRAQTILQSAFPHSFARSTAVVVLTGPLAQRQAAVADYSTYSAHRLRPAPFTVASDSLTPELRGALAPMVDLLAREITRAADAGLVRRDDAARDAQTIFGLLLSAIHDVTIGRADPLELAPYVWGFCWAGLQGEAAARGPTELSLRH